MQDSEVGGRPQGGYVEKMMLPPVALGAQIVTLEPHRFAQKHTSGKTQVGRGNHAEVLVYNQTLRNAPTE